VALGAGCPTANPARSPWGHEAEHRLRRHSKGRGRPSFICRTELPFRVTAWCICAIAITTGSKCFNPMARS
jgi:hypothetical protein